MATGVFVTSNRVSKSYRVVKVPHVVHFAARSLTCDTVSSFTLPIVPSRQRQIRTKCKFKLLPPVFLVSDKFHGQNMFDFLL